MSLSEDHRTQEFHREMGTLDAHVNGTAPIYDIDERKVAEPQFDANGVFTGHVWVVS